jgi:hypothetical protein
MRIGTWNLKGEWTPRHQKLLDTQDCDVWLLTEVHPRSCQQGRIAAFQCYLSSGVLKRTHKAPQHCAAIASRSLMKRFFVTVHYPASSFGARRPAR